jgi:hypothetical protein
MANPVLYSTNPYFTERVCDLYLSGVYGMLWCSEHFDPASHGAHSHASHTVPSSSPKPLYYEVLDAVRKSDSGNAKLESYRRTFAKLARDWLSRSKISQFHHDEILALVRRYPFTIWEPRLFVIPREAVERSKRLHVVPAHKRSGVGAEFQVFNLKRDEFDIIMIEP